MIHKLSNGIEILFHDLPELSPEILNQATRFCKLDYQRQGGFFIITRSHWLSSAFCKIYARELTQLAAACDEANEILKQRNNKTQ